MENWLVTTLEVDDFQKNVIKTVDSPVLEIVDLSDEIDNVLAAGLFGFNFNFSCSKTSYILIVLVLISALYYFLNEFGNNKGWISIGILLLGIVVTILSILSCSLTLPLLAFILIVILGFEFREKFGIRY